MIWRRKAVEDQFADWVEDRWQWLDEHFPQKNPALILPTKAFFNAPSGRDHATAEAVLADVQAHYRIKDAKISLIRQPEKSEYRAQDFNLTSDVAGTFLGAETHSEITYQPELMQSPRAFIATIAHEVAHFVLRDFVDDAPGGYEEHELLTDLTVIHFGFGILALTGARDVGWQGYLSNATRAYALAVFLASHKIDPALALEQLDRFTKRLLNKAIKQHARNSAEHPSGVK